MENITPEQILDLLSEDKIFKKDRNSIDLLDTIEYEIKQIEEKDDLILEDFFFNRKKRIFEIEICCIGDDNQVIEKEYTLKQIADLLNK